MARRILLLLLPIMAAVLLAEIGVVNFGPSGLVTGLEAAELRSGDLSPGSQPALTRGGAVMAAVESSRRKLRVPQRPQGQSLILTDRVIADGAVEAHAYFAPSSEPPLKAAQPTGAFLARGPPAWNFA